MNREQLIVAHLPLAYGVAHKFFLPGANRDDVNQEAALAVIEAAGRYDPAKGDFAGLVVTIVNRRLVDRLQHEQREKRRAHHEAMRTPLAVDEEGDQVPLIDLYVTTTDDREAADELARIRELWTTLTPLERRSMLAVINGTPYRGDKTTDNAIQRARKKLREAA